MCLFLYRISYESCYLCLFCQSLAIFPKIYYPSPPGADDAAAGGEGGEGEDVPDWCNPTKEMGAWLNYKNIRVICGERGFEDFGPYGGIPSEDGEGEEGGEEAEEA